MAQNLSTKLKELKEKPKSHNLQSKIKQLRSKMKMRKKTSEERIAKMKILSFLDKLQLNKSKESKRRETREKLRRG
jgi:hypothetical protein